MSDRTPNDMLYVVNTAEQSRTLTHIARFPYVSGYGPRTCSRTFQKYVSEAAALQQLNCSCALTAHAAALHTAAVGWWQTSVMPSLRGFLTPLA
jgi:hypothetical protein